jgi:hypothetical protein
MDFPGMQYLEMPLLITYLFYCGIIILNYFTKLLLISRQIEYSLSHITYRDNNLISPLARIISFFLSVSPLFSHALTNPA